MAAGPHGNYCTQRRKNMPSVLKGNFKTQKDVVTSDEEESLEDRFEREVLKKLGGSISFVSKKKVKWADEDKT
jgi:hypothetical protein